MRELVANAHGDLDAVREALDVHPTLVNAAWDWGGGDWETALGAAAHVGRRDIAELLLGRRTTRRLRRSDARRGRDRARDPGHQPEARDAKGPHGIPLRAHAEAGGEQARRVLELLDVSA